MALERAPAMSRVLEAVAPLGLCRGRLRGGQRDTGQTSKP